MRTTERLFTFGAVALSLALGLSAYLSTGAGNRAVAATAAFNADTKIATCDVFKAASKLMDTERFKKEVEDKRNTLKDQMKPLETELQGIAQKLQAMGKDARGPEAEQTARDFQTKQQEYLKLGQQLDVEMGKFIAGKNFDAYKLVLDSVNAISDRKGYTHVFSTRSTEDMKSPENPSAFLQGVLARPLARSPQGDDITPDVLADLKLE